jgi:hypothetical protein
MFVGHFGVGLGGKRIAPRVSLGTWFLAIQLLDLIWPVFLLLGWENVRITPGYTRMNPLDFYDYPLTHSLLGALFWSAAFALVYRLLHRRPGPGRLRVPLLLGAGVLSHWVLDLVVHAPDLPVLPKMGPYLGLGLWNHPVAAIAIELALYVLGAALYLGATRARDAAGRFGLWTLLIVLGVIWLASLFGPPPPDEKSLAWVALAQWLFVAWGYWADRHRVEG